jgi:tetratricopeptide (TPR) repeat protein
VLKPTIAPGAWTRRPAGIALLALVIGGSAGAGYYAWRRAHHRVVPPIQTTDLELEVVAAIDQAKDDVEQSPRSAEAWGKLGMVLFAHELLIESLPMFERAEQLDPGDVRWLYYRALVLWRNRPNEGAAVLQRAADLRPRDLVIQLRMGEWLLELDRAAEAERHFKAVLAAEPANPRALLGSGQILVRGEKWAEALAPLTASADHPTSRKSARAALADAYSRLGNAQAAEAERVKVAALPRDSAWPDPFINDAGRLQRGLKPRLNRINELLSVNQFEAAAMLARQIVDDYPESAGANLALGKALIRLQPADAEAPLRKAVQVEPNLHEGQYLLGTLMFELHQDYAGAESCFRKAIEIRPTHGLAHFQLGQVLLKRGDKKGALAALRDAARHRPEMARFHVALGDLLLQENQIDDAITHLEIAGNLDAKNDKARALLIEARAKKRSP